MIITKQDKNMYYNSTRDATSHKTQALNRINDEIILKKKKDRVVISDTHNIDSAWVRRKVNEK